MNELAIFYKKLVVVILAIALSLPLFAVLIYYLGETSNGAASEVYQAIELARTETSCDTLILGDSVSRQLFPPESSDETFWHLGTNQAITMAGQYILMCEYVERNPQTKNIILMMLPESLSFEFSSRWSYTYFVLPFMEEYTSQITPELDEILCKYCGEMFVHNKFVRNTVGNRQYFLQLYNDYLIQTASVKTYTGLSSVTVSYLRKIIDVCEKKGVSLYVVPSPRSDIYIETDDFRYLDADIKNYGFNDVMGDYTNRLTYYPANVFTDSTHFTKDYLNANKRQLTDSVLQVISN